MILVELALGDVTLAEVTLVEVPHGDVTLAEVTQRSGLWRSDSLWISVSQISGSQRGYSGENEILKKNPSEK